MEDTKDFDQQIVDKISSLIIPEYLKTSKLLLQVNKQENSIIIRVENNPWRNGVSSGDMLFCRIKSNGKINFFQFKKAFAEDFEKINISYSANNTESKNDMIRIPFSDFTNALDNPSDDFKALMNKVFIYNISFTQFGCCSKYDECEKAGKCLHCDQLYATACQFQKLLKRTGKFENS